MVLNKENLLRSFHLDIIMKNHAYSRMKTRNISIAMVENAILDDDIIEKYPDDFPLPSVLLLGYDNKVPLHIVCAPSDKGLIIISVYIPNENIWKNDWRTRLKEEK